MDIDINKNYLELAEDMEENKYYYNILMEVYKQPRFRDRTVDGELVIGMANALLEADNRLREEAIDFLAPR